MTAAARAGSLVADTGGLSGRSTVAALIENWYQQELLIQRIRPQTLHEHYRNARSVIVPTLGGVLIGEVTVPMCESAYAQWLLPRRAMNSAGEEFGDPRVMGPRARNAMIALRLVMARAVSIGLRTDNPAERVQLRKRQRKAIHALDASHVQQVLTAVDAYNLRPERNGPPQKYLSFALALMAGTGARIGEVLALRSVEDIDLMSSPAIVHISGTIVDLKGAGSIRQEFPKTDKGKRSVQVPIWLDEKIRSWLAEPARADMELLFETTAGRPVSPDRLQKNLRTVRDWANLPEWLVSHVMRKSVATAITAAHGTDQGMWVMGHADTRVRDERVRFSHDLKRDLRRCELLLRLRELTTQPRDLRLFPRRRADRLTRALPLQKARVTLLTPLRDQRRIQPPPAQEHAALTGLTRGLVLGQVLQLLRRRERTPTRRAIRIRGSRHDSIIRAEQRDRGTQTHRTGDPSTPCEADLL